MTQDLVCLYDPMGRLAAVRTALRDGGLACEAVNSERALREACEAGVDCLVLADHEDLDSVTLYETLVEETVLGETPVVVYTTREGADPLRRALGSGVDDVIRVPPERSELLRRRVRAAIEDDSTFGPAADQFRSLLDSYPHTLFVKDTTGRFANVTTRTANRYGFDREELIGLSDYELFDRSHADETYAEEQTVIEEERETIDKIEHYVDEDGRDQWVSTTRVPRYDQEGNVIGLVGGTMYVTTAKRQEQLISDLQEASQRLARAKTRSDVASATVDIAGSVDAFSHAEVALVDDGDALTPMAATDGDNRLFETHRTIFEQTFAQAEPEDSAVNPDQFVRLGEHGVLAYEVAETQAFDDFIDRLVRVYSANVTAALDRAEREQRLTDTTNRIEEFATLGSHELRNKLQIVLGNVADAESDYDDPRLRRSIATLDRVDHLLRQMLQLARTGSIPHERSWIELETAATAAWERVDTSEISLSIESTATVEANRDALVGLFEFLFENVADHAGSGATAIVGSMEDQSGFYVEDDGSGIDADKPSEFFVAEYTDTADSNGYGLYVTAAIVDGHDWSINVSESGDGGARFEICGVTERVEY